MRDIVAASGFMQVQNSKRYDSFGRVIAETNISPAFDVIFGYTGREFDAETGLQYNRARYYDPHSGRFISSDPSGFASGDANRYRYVGNNPINATDPSGLAARYLGSTRTQELTSAWQQSAPARSSMYTPNSPSSLYSEEAASPHHWVDAWADTWESNPFDIDWSDRRSMIFGSRDDSYASAAWDYSDGGSAAYESILSELSWDSGRRQTTPSVAMHDFADYIYDDDPFGMQAEQNRLAAIGVELEFARRYPPPRTWGQFASDAVVGSLRMVAGVPAAISGAALTASGIGAIPGVPLAAWGIDQTATGFANIAIGGHIDSIGVSVIQRYGGHSAVGRALAIGYDTIPAFLTPSPRMPLSAPARFEAPAVRAFADREFAAMGRVPYNAGTVVEAMPGGRAIPFIPRTPSLPSSASVADILGNGWIPGHQGITVSDRYVRFADLYRMTERHGIEFGLTREIAGGSPVYRICSGGGNAVTMPFGPGTRIIGHTHPSGARLPSPRDIQNINRVFLNSLETDPLAPVPHSRVIWGSGVSDSTIYFPNVLR